MKKKMMFSIQAVLHNETGTRAISSNTFTFFRPYCTKTPTFLGAARMIAAAQETPTKPSNVSVLRIESHVYETR